MAISKVVYGDNTLIDLTGDTVTPDSLLAGATAHTSNGSKITGTLKTVTYHTGNSEPEASLGDDGDLYLVVE